MRNALEMRGKYYEWDNIKDDGLITLCVIRDPLKRIISSYQYLLKLEDNGFLNKHPIYITEKTEFFKFKNLPIESFNMFLKYIEINGFYDAVTLPQVDFLSDRGITIEDIDEVFLVDRLSEDFEKFKIKYDIKSKIKHDNTSNHNISKLLNSYIENNPKIKKQIINIYKNDFEMYDSLKKNG